MHADNQCVLRDEAIGFLVERINYEQTGLVPYHSRNFKLDRMQKLLEAVGNPQDKLRIVHIAGTKGKGSTAAFLSSMLTAAGYRTGVYSSPHLERLEERFAVDGQCCSAAELVQLVNDLRAVLGPLDRGHDSDETHIQNATYFELTTAMALLHFVRRDVDFAVMEVGLGGRLDSTNVCRPLVSVITSISLDHTQQLGSTISAIAAEKAGIIKPGIPVVAGVEAADARQVVRQKAAEQGCSLRLVDESYFYRFRWQSAGARTTGPIDASIDGQIDAPADGPSAGLLDYHESGEGGLGQLTGASLGMPGAHQAANAAVALAIVGELRRSGWTLPEPALRHGLASARSVARIEVVNRSPLVVLDSAHNVASVRALVDTLRGGFPCDRRRLVFACSQDKDVAGMLAVLLPHFQHVALTRYRNNPRAVEPRQLAEIAANLLTRHAGPVPTVTTCDDPLQAWRQVRTEAADGDLLCVAGSFFLAAELRALVSRQTTPTASP